MRMDELALEIQRAELKRPFVPEEIVRGWLLSFKSGDREDPAFRERLLKAFVTSVTIFPEEIEIVYNTTEKGPSRSSSTAPLSVGVSEKIANNGLNKDSPEGSSESHEVEIVGLEPAASSLPARRSPN